MLHRTRADRAACIADPALFQHELLEGPVPSRGDGDRRREATLLAARAAAACSDCPLFESCLYDAVVKHDVAGFVAGTTEAQRTRMRAALGVKVEAEDLDAFAGVIGGGRRLDHEEVLRLRNANPHESLDVLAMRLGCSLSTIKRHMRRARAAAGEVKLTAVKPTMERVLAAFDAVVRPNRSRETRVA